MIGLDDIRGSATALPEVTERPHFGRPAFRVLDKLFLSVHPDDDPPSAIAHVSQETAAAAVEADRDVAEEVWRTHGERRIFVGLRIDLAAASPEYVNDLVVLAWRHRAPKRLAATLPDT